MKPFVKLRFFVVVVVGIVKKCNLYFDLINEICNNGWGFVG